MNKHKVWEIICIVLLVCFISMMSFEEAASDKTAKEVGTAISQKINTEGLKKQSEIQIKKELSLSSKSYGGIFYLKSDEIMDVREVLVIKLAPNQSADEAIELIKKRVDEKITLFDGYAPEQSALLKNYVLKQKAGFVFYAVSDEIETAVSAFNDVL